MEALGSYVVIKTIEGRASKKRRAGGPRWTLRNSRSQSLQEELEVWVTTRRNRGGGREKARVCKGREELFQRRIPLGMADEGSNKMKSESVIRSGTWMSLVTGPE